MSRSLNLACSEKLSICNTPSSREMITNRGRDQIQMKLKGRIEQMGTLGHILLWLLGMPIPVFILFFLLRDCAR
jgi:hypothetical protein